MGCLNVHGNLDIERTNVIWSGTNWAGLPAPTNCFVQPKEGRFRCKQQKIRSKRRTRIQDTPTRKGGKLCWQEMSIHRRRPNSVRENRSFTFQYNYRGRILTGVVRKQKMTRTIIVRRDYLHFVRKYGRFEKRHNVSNSSDNSDKDKYSAQSHYDIDYCDTLTV